RRAEVVAAAQLGLTGVEADPHVQRDPTGPPFVLETLDEIDHRAHGRARVLKDRERRIAFAHRTNEAAAALLDSARDDRVMADAGAVSAHTADARVGDPPAATSGATKPGVPARLETASGDDDTPKSTSTTRPPCDSTRLAGLMSP